MSVRAVSVLVSVRAVSMLVRALSVEHHGIEHYLTACDCDSVIPVTALVNRFYGRWLQKNQQQVQNALAKANDVAQEVGMSFPRCCG